MRELPTTGAAIPGELRVALGRAVVSCSCAHPAWLAIARKRLTGFLTDSEAAWHLEIVVESGPKTWLDGDREPRTHLDGDALLVRGDTFEARVDLAIQRGVVRGPLAAYPLDATLRILATTTDADGLVLHAAGVAHDGHGWACGGPSGCGKTTLASLLGPRALCDEHVLVSRDHGGFELQSLPFWNGRPGAARLAGIHLLRHAPTHRRRRLDPVQAARALTGLVLWPSWSPERTARAFQLLTELATAVPVYDLAFAPRPDVWDALTAE